MIEVYAIADRPEAGVPGEEGLELQTHGPLAAVYTRVEDRPRNASPDALWRHEQLVEALMADRAVLPMRYGTVLADEWELQRVLAARAEEFQRLLDAVRGRVELAVRVQAAVAPAAQARPESGREYMRTRLLDTRRADEAAVALKPLAELADAAVKREAVAGDLTRWAYLVEHGRLYDFKAGLERVEGSHPELRITCTGPWPPYSFVSGGR